MKITFWFSDFVRLSPSAWRRFAQESFLEFQLGRALAVSLRLTEPSYILIEAMPQR
jgi:hypothetical protein